MVRSLALGFGMITALAVAGAMTPAGQGVLGNRHPTESVVQVSSIQDKPAAVPGPAHPLVAAPAAPTAAPARVATATPSVPPGQRRPQTAPVATRPQASSAPRTGRPTQAGPAQGGLGGVAGIANILLNLPQVLDPHAGPSRGPDGWSGSDRGHAKAHKWRPGQGGDEKEPDENH